MRGASNIVGAAALGAIYFVAAGAAISSTRFGGGVACLWIATAILAAVLISRRRRNWAPPIIACAIASMATTCLWGFGWRAAIPFALVNILEAVVGASLFRRIDHRDRSPFVSFGWFRQIVFAVGLAAPIVAGVPAALIAHSLGLPLLTSFTSFVAGHALGALTFTPLCLVVSNPASRRESLAAIAKRWRSFTCSMLLFAALSVSVFSTDRLPLLFLPILPLILLTLWQGREATALGVVILALAGGIATATGHGPIQLLDSGASTRLVFLQFYLASTVLTVLPIAADLHARRRLLRDMTISEQRFRMLAEQTSDILLQLSPDGEVIYVSPSIRQLGGHDPDQLIGSNARQLVLPDHRDRVRDAHRATVAQPGTTRSVDYLAMMADGSTRWFETRARALVDLHGRVEGTLSVIRDISARKEVEARLTAAAMTDTLTGLPNRRAFELAVADRMVDRAPGDHDCVAVFDIDLFKRVNDTYGHDVGDIVLRRFAHLLRNTVRSEDQIARIGGEEFVVLFPNTPIAQVLGICERMRVNVAAMELVVKGARFKVTVSGGVAPLIDGFESALKQADQALYVAKRGGRDQLALAA